MTGMLTRFQLIKAGTLPVPGICITCGTTDRDCIWFGATNIIDTPDGKRYGSVLICVECFKSATREVDLGLITTEEYEKDIADLGADWAAVVENTKKDVSKLERVDESVTELNSALDMAFTRFKLSLANELPDLSSIDPVEDSKPKPKSAKSKPAVEGFGGFDWAGGDK